MPLILNSLLYRLFVYITYMGSIPVIEWTCILDDLWIWQRPLFVKLLSVYVRENSIINSYVGSSCYLMKILKYERHESIIIIPRYAGLINEEKHVYSSLFSAIILAKGFNFIANFKSSVKCKQ